MRASPVVALATAAFLTPALAGAQLRLAPRPDLSDPATRACVAALPPSDFKPTLVWLGAGGARFGDSAAVDALFLLAQDVATRMREQLGAPSGVVPLVESTVPWTAVWGRLNGELHTDGLVTIEPRQPRNGADTLASVGDTIIERALQSLLSDGELWPFVPTEWALSWRFTLFFVAPDATVENTTFPAWRAVGIPVFTRSLPTYAPVRWSRESMLPPDFRRWDRAGAFNDSVTFRFTYDPKGDVDLKSVNEVPHRDDVEGLGMVVNARFAREPADEKRRAQSRAQFVSATARSLERSHWTIGRLGSCPLPRVAYQTFTVIFANRP